MDLGSISPKATLAYAKVKSELDRQEKLSEIRASLEDIHGEIATARASIVLMEIQAGNLEAELREIERADVEGMGSE